MYLKNKSFRKKRKKPKLNIDNLDGIDQQVISSDLDENLHVLRSIYEDCADVVFRPFLINGKMEAYLIFIEGFSNIEEIDASVLAPLMQADREQYHSTNEMFEKIISVSKVTQVLTFADCVNQISMGNPVILLEREKLGFAVGLAKWEKRSIEEPQAEMVIRGPREGFIEALGVNTTLLRRKVRSSKLKMKSMEIGRYTQTKVVVAYMEGIADKTLLEEVFHRLKRIDIDGILESGYIEELIEDSPFSPFPQMMNTERPDICVANLLEGRVAILIDGTPSVLIAPTTLYSLLQSNEDYYQGFIFATVMRWLRFIFLLTSLLLPSFYVAVLTYHQEMVPSSLLISMAASREMVPFPALIEALIMEITFEGLREAGIRLPKQMGSAVSIVGALVLGEAALYSGLVSAPMLMVVAFTGIASFTLPRYNFGIVLRMLRFPMIILAGTLGLLGIMIGILMILTHLCTLRSFGVPYLTPMGPMKGRDMKDVLIRAPWWMLNTRPHLTGEDNEYRQDPEQKPDPIHEDDKISRGKR